MQIVVAIASAMIAGIVAVYLMYFRKRKPAQAKTTKQQVTQPVEEEVLEITEEDINNIRRIPELINIIEALRISIGNGHNGNGSREVSLFEALAQITRPVPEVPWVMPITQSKPVTHIHKERTPEEKSAWGKKMAEARKVKKSLDKH